MSERKETKSRLKTAFEQAKGEAVQQDQSAIQYSILKHDVDTANSLYTEFLHKTSQAGLELAQQRNNMNIIQPAQIPRSPEGPRAALAILMALMLSLAGGVGLAFVLEKFDTSIKNVGDVNRFAQLPTLGVIPSIASTPARRLASKRGNKSLFQYRRPQQVYCHAANQIPMVIRREPNRLYMLSTLADSRLCQKHTGLSGPRSFYPPRAARQRQYC